MLKYEDITQIKNSKIIDKIYLYTYNHIIGLRCNDPHAYYLIKMS